MRGPERTGRERIGACGLVVWISAWQVQCCGQPFAVGQYVSWTCSDQPDVDWLAAAVGDQVARSITHTEDHHEVSPEPLTAVRGRVVSIRAASCRFGPRPGDGRVLVPLPGSTRLRQVEQAGGWEREDPEFRFTGYLVELQVAGDA